ncbi:diaminobutyrate--2-oxoglutarate aminotransferase [Streptomyces sp. Ru87]|nr:diaminobutyrate--2-oxoglutarate aminotransferase [Streptomyces sp. Ru87]
MISSSAESSRLSSSLLRRGPERCSQEGRSEVAVTESPVAELSAGQGGVTAREPGARSLPVVPVRARGLTIEGADGRRYLDCASGSGALALGHNHPVVLRAIRSVLDSGAPLHTPGLVTGAEEDFTAELLRTLPAGLAERARVRFCSPAAGDPVPEALRLVAAGGRPGALLRPVRGDGGVTPAPDARVRELRERTAAAGIPLIADETRTGVGRTGAFWAVGHSGVVPDVMVVARAIGGSLPLAAVVHRDDLVPGAPQDRADSFRGNQLAMAAGAATLAYVRENGLAARAADLGGRMLRQLRDFAAGLPCAADVRGRGLLIGIAFAAPGRAARVRNACLRRGLIVELAGRKSGVVLLLPPLTVTDEQAAAVLDRLTDAVQAEAALRHGP